MRRACEQHSTSVLVVAALVLSGTTASAAPTVSLDRNPVPKYERLEMTVTHGTAYSNPFDPAEVDVHCDFVSPSAQNIRVNGFWDGSSWKIRFAGSEVGEYSHTVSFVDGSGTHSAAPGTFSVTNSSDHGWVRVSQGDSHYLEHNDGTPFYGVGFCRPWNVESVPNLFPTMKTNGCNFLSYWLPVWDHSILRNADGYARYNMGHAAAIDAVMADAEANDVKILFTVWYHGFLRDDTHYIYVGDPNPENHYQYNPFHVLASASDWFENASCQTYARNYYRYLIARWGYSRALGAWQTVTEINLTNVSDTYDGLWANDHLDQARMDTWHTSLNDYFKQNDPFGHPTHAAWNNPGDWPGGMPAMDITGGHTYPTLDKISTRGDLKYPAMLTYGKPCFMSECGLRVSEGEANRTAYQHLAAWSGLVTGGGITPMMWCDGGGEWGTHTTAMYEQMQHFRNFTDTLDLTGQGFAKRSMVHTVPGGRGWCLRGSDQHVVWIEDKTPGETISGSQVTISGMSAGTYEVKAYNTWAGTWHPPYNRAVGGSSLTITLPDFQQDIAVRVAPPAAASVPVLSSPTHASIQATTATLGATVTGNGGATVTARGTTWGTTANPTGNKVATGSGLGSFTHGRTGLPAETHVYYRGYAVNSAGTGYSPVGDFYTEPATQASGIGFSNVTHNRMRITWTNGSGAGRIVIVKAGSDVSAAPPDGTEHAASTVFGSGAQLGTGNYVVYRSTGSQADVTGLSADTTNYVKIYEYAGSGNQTNYEQDSPPSASRATGTAPPVARYPFPQAATYSHGIKPNAKTQAEMDSACQSTYEAWKAQCLTQSGSGTPPGAWRVQVDASTTGDTVSEAIGYGMLIMVYMDNDTNDTRQYFDGLWLYYNAFLDTRGLMHWAVNADGSLAGENAATDADEDVALALIVADKQWGSGGNVNYLREATNLLAKIAQHEIDAAGVLKPGDAWGNPPVNPSYFSPGYYRVFYEVTSNDRFSTCIDQCYRTLGHFYTNYSTALVPDWCKASGAQQSGMSYNYTWDACRTPWRMGTDYLWYGTSNHALAYDWCNKLTTWIKGNTGGDAGQIKSGYTLNGTVTEPWNKAPFVGPFGVAAMVDASHQTWCNNVWNRLESVGDNVYYHLSIKMLTQLVMSGNMPNLCDSGPPPPARFEVSFQQGNLRVNGVLVGDGYRTPCNFLQEHVPGGINTNTLGCGNQWFSGGAYGGNGSQLRSMLAFDLSQIAELARGRPYSVTNVSLVTQCFSQAEKPMTHQLCATDPFTSSATWNNPSGDGNGSGETTGGTIGDELGRVWINSGATGMKTWGSSPSFLAAISNTLDRSDKTLYLLLKETWKANEDSLGKHRTPQYATLEDRPKLIVHFDRHAPASRIDRFVVNEDGTVSIGWTDVGGSYILQWTTNLLDPDWLPVGGGGPAVSNGWSGTGHRGMSQVYYRVMGE